jgi:signal transduction histidine kinase
MQREFQGELTALHDIQALRHATLAELCRVLVRKPRIHAALEDNALDLLYPSAKDELRDVMERQDQTKQVHQARFYRFLDQNGAVIPPTNTPGAGRLRPEEEAQLRLPGLPRQQQMGYLATRPESGPAVVAEVIAMTIASSETDEAIAALVIGFNPVETGRKRAEMGIKSGIWLNGRLYFAALPEVSQSALGAEVTRSIAAPGPVGRRFTVQVEGMPHLLFYQQLNPGSRFPPAYEVSIYPLTNLLARQRQLRWQIVGAGGFMLLGGLAASRFLAARLSRPVEQLAVDSVENRAQRERAEAALALSHEGLQRAMRFSADASHQLKTPVTVLRAGLEELLAREDLAADMREEIANLVHQTYRLNSLIEDLLLLSRMDAGRLQIQFAPVDLRQLIEGWLDDLGVLPDALHLAVESNLPPVLQIAGEKRYITLIVQNLLENARKYNRPEGSIRVAAREEGDWILLTIGNTGRPITAEAQEHIFERFHRGVIGENIPGYGLGLNLARELARLHGGDLRLARSDEAWTEFEVRFRTAKPSPLAPGDLA